MKYNPQYLYKYQKAFFKFKTHKSMKKLKWFTMLEILIITIVVWVWLLSIVFAINKVKSVTNQIKQETIATQLAKEWVELIYHNRNTNILKNPLSWQLCWLNINKNENCDWNNDRFKTWSYIILSWNIITWTMEDLILSGWISTWDKNFALCLNEWKRIACPGEENHTKYWKFFRTIKWIGLYNKNTNTTWWNLLNCTKWNDANCADNIAKEYRFCSTVFYIWEKIWKSEICSILTNFFD